MEHFILSTVHLECASKKWQSAPCVGNASRKPSAVARTRFAGARERCVGAWWRLQYMQEYCFNESRAMEHLIMITMHFVCAGKL